MHRQTCTQVLTYNTHIQSHTQTPAQTYLYHTFTHTHIHTYIPTYRHSHRHTYICTYIHTYIFNTQTYTYTHIHSYTHVQIDTHTHTRVHTHTCIHITKPHFHESRRVCFWVAQFILWDLPVFLMLQIRTRHRKEVCRIEPVITPRPGPLGEHGSVHPPLSPPPKCTLTAS